jgi:nitroreductase
MNVSEAIRTKRAVRTFTEQPLPAEVEESILEAGRRAQSSKNSQPWHFVVIHDRATLQELATCGAFAGHLAGAAMGLVLVGPTAGEFDLGQAAAYMQLAAWEQGVGSCLATIYEPEKARALLGIPAEQDVHYALSFGYPAPRPAPTVKKKIARNPLDEIVRREKW